MNRIRSVLIGAFLMIVSCEDITIKNITDESIELIGPPADLIESPQTFTFWWNELEAAEKYQLIIVSPDIQSPYTLSLDTLLVRNKFDYQLPSGKFEWCVRAKNSAYETQYFCRKITIN